MRTRKGSAGKLGQPNADALVDTSEPLPGCDAVAEWRDNFDDDQIEMLRWVPHADPGASAAEIGSQLVLSLGMGAVEKGRYADLESRTSYDLTSARLAVRLVGVTSFDHQLQAALFARAVDGVNALAVFFDQAMIQCASSSAVAYEEHCGTGYNPSTHRFLGLRFDGAIHYEASADGLTWTELAMQVAPFAITDLRIGMYVYMLADGTDPGAATFDDFLLCRL